MTLDIHCYKDEGLAHDDPKCYEIQAIPPVIQNRINGFIYCGRRAKGNSFAEV